ncbi:MAG: pectate lyase [Bacteroidaceae bacterium]|nr:pectate lyase [Bacteroidaceae bacterium]
MRKHLLKVFSTILLGCLLSGTSASAEEVEKLPAFPGAEGFGRYVTGGRGGAVYHVTNLNDSGEGSLRWALGQNGTKTIVFDVSGTIHLQSSLNIPANTTIAGQTAPGDGICVAGYPCSIKGSNVIVRFMRFRLGNENVLVDGADGWDGFGGFDQRDLMIDHCSVSWSIDECLSVLGNVNTTVQWCLVSQSLVNSGHTKGAHGYGGNWGGSGASFHHNLIAHHTSRTPRLGPRPTTQLDERMDMRNNVIYNFGGNGCYGGEGMTVNIVNNYYKPGPGSPTGNKGKRIAGVGIRTNKYVTDNPAYAPALHKWGKYYVDGNVNSKYSDVTNDNWTYGFYNQISSSDNDGLYTAVTKDTIKLVEPMDFVYVTTHSAKDAYEKVLQYAGASLSRDCVDTLMVYDTRYGKASHTGSGLGKGFINSQNDNKPANAPADWSAWPVLKGIYCPEDTDQDGMPDDWEYANGLNPNDAADRNTKNSEGYTMLEVYMNSLVAHIMEGGLEGGEPLGYSIMEENAGRGDAVLLSASTCTNSNWGFPNGYSISTGKGYSTGKEDGIKYSRGQTYTINLPENIQVESVDFTGYCNYADADGYLAQLGNVTYGEEEYVFPRKDSDGNYEVASHSVVLPSPVAGTLPVKFNGQQVVMSMTLWVRNTANGIGQRVAVPVIKDHVDVYDLYGRLVRNQVDYRHALYGLPSGIYIVDGKKVNWWGF